MKKNSLLPDFNRSQRRGIIIMLLLIILAQMAIFYHYKIFPKKQVASKIPLTLQQQYDSLKVIALKKHKLKIYPFNPNYLSDEKAYFLGLSLEQIDKINTYRKTGKYIQSKEAFKKVAGLSDSLYNVLEPYIKIKTLKKYPEKTYKNHQLSTTDINKASVQDLQSINGIGVVLSSRIIKYRNAIGGFTNRNQLNKVYGLEPEVIQRVWQKFKIKSKADPVNHYIVKPVNTATTQDFKAVYGIGDKLAKRIVKYRKKIGGFTIPEQLNGVYGLKPEVINEFWQRFKIENPAKIALKINVNDANIKELAKNPYISYQLAKKIVSYRTLNGAFRNFDDLLNITDYPKNIHKPICLYLKL